jgi:hypothetical protein
VIPRSGAVRFDPEHGGFVVRETGPGREVPARLPWLAGEILAVDPSELMRLDPPARPLRQLHALLVELVEWQLESAPRAPLPPGLLRSAEAGR